VRGRRVLLLFLLWRRPGRCVSVRAGRGGERRGRTSAPMYWQSWIAAIPTPPVAEWIKTRWKVSFHSLRIVRRGLLGSSACLQGVKDCAW
jgi:hypothetical protein